MRVFTLESERLRARILDFGATLMSLEAPDRHGTWTDVVLGFDDPERYHLRHPYLGATVGRYANRIAEAKFSIDGNDYQLSVNEGRHHLHGGENGFHRVTWQAQRHGSALRFRYVSRDGDEGYPGTVTAVVTYRIQANVLMIDYHASTDRPTVLNLTNHAYFNLGGAGAVDEHLVRIPAARYVEVDAERIPTGRLLPVADTAMDFQRARPLGRVRVDHCFVLDGEIELHDPASGRLLRIRTTQPGAQFYTGDLLDGSVRGRDGTAYGPRAALCLEPQHFPDSPNQPAFPSTVLRPGEQYRHRSSYEFSVQR
ncbi:MAG TPA: aldose epimerase family protein [Vicinamibacterales bacterium]|nr:aldose epimerase family protein [Vicinamibacterales bacterium]